jgi:uncharacterized protein (TIGR02147 family)
MITVFDYLDYRDFLRDYYKEQKRVKPFFSYRFIGHHVGMDSSYVIKVLQGKIHLSIKKVDCFIKLLDLNETEAEYFKTLVHFCRAKTDHERKLYFDKLFSISTVKAQCLDTHHYEFFQKWYYSAIWSIVNGTPFHGDFRALANRCLPPITVWEAKRGIKLLEHLGLIEKDQLGVYRTRDLNLTTGQKWHSQAIDVYQREMIRLAGESIERCTKPERDISTVTLCFDEKNMPELKECIKQFRSSLIKLANNYGGTERAYQLNVQLFPISTVSGKEP